LVSNEANTHKLTKVDESHESEAPLKSAKKQQEAPPSVKGKGGLKIKSTDASQHVDSNAGATVVSEVVTPSVDKASTSESSSLSTPAKKSAGSNSHHLETTTATSTATTNPSMDDLQKLILSFHAKKNAKYFRTAVTEEEAPGYSEFVSHPMDLSKLSEYVKSSKIQCLQDLAVGLKLIDLNCQLYNYAPDGSYMRDASKMFFDSCIKSISNSASVDEVYPPKDANLLTPTMRTLFNYIVKQTPEAEKRITSELNVDMKANSKSEDASNDENTINQTSAEDSEATSTNPVSLKLKRGRSSNVDASTSVPPSVLSNSPTATVSSPVAVTVKTPAPSSTVVQATTSAAAASTIGKRKRKESLDEQSAAPVSKSARKK
jgi:Bromodomain